MNESPVSVVRHEHEGVVQEAAVHPDGTVDSLKLSAGDWSGELSRRGDAWLWRDGRGERLWGLSGELQPVFGGPLSDSLLLRRAALAPQSQKRMEVLRVARAGSEPTYVILDRLDDGTGPLKRYRLTDDQGHAIFLEGA